MESLPSLIEKLAQKRQLALITLLPEGTAQKGRYFCGEYEVNLSSWNYFNQRTRKHGTFIELWQEVRNKKTEFELREDIHHFLLNIQSPKNMARFEFSSESMEKIDEMHGERIQIFPQVYMYAGTTTLLAGYNGSGKSTLATQIGHIAAQYGIKTFILSPEMPPEVTGKIIRRQSTNVDMPTKLEWDRTKDYVRDNFLVSTIEDMVTPETAIDQFTQAYKMGCRLIILDSLTCVRSGPELHHQANFADDLRAWSRSHPDAYLLVLAHMRKPNQFTSSVSRYDIRGAGQISDLAGHVWLLQRKNPFNQKEQAFYGDYDAKIVVDKNRATGELCCKMLRFSKPQLLFHVTKQPPRYVDCVTISQDKAIERIY